MTDVLNPSYFLDSEAPADWFISFPLKDRGNWQHSSLRCHTVGTLVCRSFSTVETSNSIPNG